MKANGFFGASPGKPGEARSAAASLPAKGHMRFVGAFGRAKSLRSRLPLRRPYLPCAMLCLNLKPRLLAAFGLLFLGINPTHAQQSNRVDFQEGFQFYQQQGFDTAFALWNQAPPAQWSPSWCGYTSRAAWQSGKKIDALLWLYRGLLMEPNHPVLRKDLQHLLASLNLSREMPPLAPSFWVGFSIDALAAMALAAAWTALLWLFFHWLVPKNSTGSLAFRFTFFLLLLLCFFSFGLALAKNQWLHRNRALVAKDGLVLRQLPKEEAEEVQTLQAGQRLEWSKKSGAWVEVRLANDLTGWIPEKELMPINYPSQP